MINPIIDRYEIIEELGAGGFGQTFLAKDTRMPSQRIVVVKKLTPINHSNLDYQIIRDSFKKEAAALENLENQLYHIPKLYDHFEYRGNFYLIQEYIKGKTLAQISPISQKQAFSILNSLLKTLIYIHSKKIIHRDIKPENIIIRQSDEVPFLIDFGAVKDSMGKTQLHSGTVVSSKIIGTKGYMAPEQTAGYSLFSSDLYSLARTMIYALTKKLPIEFEMNPITGQLDWLKYLPEIDPKLAFVLNKANQISPELRYSTAEEMNEDLYFDSQIKTKVANRNFSKKSTIINSNSAAKNSTNEKINLGLNFNSTEQIKPHQKDIPTVIIPKPKPKIWKWFIIGSMSFSFTGLIFFVIFQSVIRDQVDLLREGAKDFYIAKEYQNCMESAKKAINKSQQLLVFGNNSLQDKAIDIQNKCQLENDKELLSQTELFQQKQTYIEAIKMAQKISNYDLNIYQKAQTIISDSVKVMLNNAQTKYDSSGDSNIAITEVKPLLQLFTPESQFYQEINSNLQTWKSDEKSNKDKLNQAQLELKKGNWIKAGDIANSVTTSYYQKLAQPIKEQAFEGNNQSLLASAKARYNKGDLKGAIDLANQVNQNSSVYLETKEMLNLWQSELDDLKLNIKSFFESYFSDINNSNYEKAWSYLSKNYQNKVSQTKFQEKWQDKQVSLENLEINKTLTNSIIVNISRKIAIIDGETTTSETFCLVKDNQLFSQFKIELTQFCK